MTEPVQRFRTALDLAATVAMLVAAGVLVSLLLRPQTQRSSGARKAVPVPTQPLLLEGALERGNPLASVGLLEYSDFQCPFCGKFARETLPAIEENYVDPGRVLLAFQNYPLKLHPRATAAAVASECAARQGRFWDWHDRVFHDQAHLDDDSLRRLATELHLDVPQFDSCTKAPDVTRGVENDGAAASALHITGTPTLFVGRMAGRQELVVTEVIEGAQPLATFVDSLNKALTATPR